jgi:hypothetical protein
MTFTLSTANIFYDEPDEMKRLEELGFTFQKTVQHDFIIFGHPSIEIDTLEELMRFIKKYDDIVLTPDKIIIYDGYLE